MYKASLTSVSIAWGERGVEEGLVLGLLALALALALASSLEGLLTLRLHPAGGEAGGGGRRGRVSPAKLGAFTWNTASGSVTTHTHYTGEART